MDVPFFFLPPFFAPPLQFPGKDVYLFTGRQAIQQRERETKSFILRHVLLILCPTCSLTAAFSSSLSVSVLSLFSPSMLCVLTLSLALPLLNNKPSVCKCVWLYFWPLQGHKALSSLLLLLFLSLSVFLFCSYMALSKSL